MMVRRLLLLALLGAASAFAPMAPRAAVAPSASCSSRVPDVQMIRHGNKLKKLGRPADQRKALLRALTTELIRHGRIKTTLHKAKALRKPADHMVTLAKEGSLHARRQALGYIYDKQLVHALFEQAPERYADREGGYTRVLRDGFRRGDNAEMGIIEVSAENRIVCPRAPSHRPPPLDSRLLAVGLSVERARRRPHAHRVPHGCTTVGLVEERNSRDNPGVDV